METSAFLDGATRIMVRPNRGPIRTQEDNFLPNEVLPRHGNFTLRGHHQCTRYRSLSTVRKPLRDIESAPRPIVHHV